MRCNHDARLTTNLAEKLGYCENCNQCHNTESEEIEEQSCEIDKYNAQSFLQELGKLLTSVHFYDEQYTNKIIHDIADRMYHNELNVEYGNAMMTVLRAMVLTKQS